MHNAALSVLGLNWRYLAFDVEPTLLPDALAGAGAMRFIGLNLTVPHKQIALHRMDALDESARLWGAVNTVRFECRAADGHWVPIHTVDPDAVQEIRAHGFNTDADAILHSLTDDLQFKPAGTRILILGAGGAGRVAALKLASENPAELFLVNRTPARAQELAAEIENRYPRLRTFVDYPEGPVDLVLNATSVGLHPEDPLPYNEHKFSLDQTGAVFDMIYQPAETPLLRLARAAGCRTSNGLGMLLHQGARALEIWCGRRAPIDVMRSALESHVYGKPPSPAAS
jgi:shikimate dehydrogenase